MGKTFTYSREEKLKSRKLTEQVFKQGKTFTVFPLKVFYTTPAQPLDFHAKVGVGASSRKFKKAVHRNYVKRILREAYRIEKLPLHQFLQQQNKQVAVFILYLDKALPPFEVIKAKMPLALQRLVRELNEATTKNT